MDFLAIDVETADVDMASICRIGKRGFLERDAESSYLALEPEDDDAMVQLQGHSITYRFAVGRQQGRKVFTLQTLPPDEDDSGWSDRVAKEAGFSLHAGVSRPRRTSATS
jgi:hypothetical protein